MQRSPASGSGQRGSDLAVGWAASTLLAKPGRRPRIRRRLVERPSGSRRLGHLRTLTAHAGLTSAGYEEWLRSYYASAFLPR